MSKKFADGLLCVLILVVLIVGFGWAFKNCAFYSHNVTFSLELLRFFGAMVSGLVCATLILLFVAWYFSDRPWLIAKKFEAGELLISDGKVLRYLNAEECYWRWDKQIVDWETKEIKLRSNLELHLQLITEKPKVRWFRYTICVELDKAPSILQALLDQGEAKIRYWPNEVMSELYDLNERCSIEMLKFYNPLRQEQQVDFGQIIKRELGPKLPPGIKITFCQFSVI